MTEGPNRLPPLLQVILDALRERGWTSDARGVLVDPEGNKYAGIEAAVTAQTFREIAAAEPPPGSWP